MSVRFVNVITERKQTKIAKPLRLLARNVSHTVLLTLLSVITAVLTSVYFSGS